MTELKKLIFYRSVCIVFIVFYFLLRLGGQDLAIFDIWFSVYAGYALANIKK